MATPTVSAISPSAGHSGGRTLVEVDGTNFRQPTVAVLVRGIAQVPPPSVAVTFGGIPATEIRWLSSSLLYVVTPIHSPGAVDVVVTNLDDTGTPIAGETVTSASGYTYLLPTLTGDQESDVVRCIRAFLQEMKRQITPNVSWPSHTDYDDATDAAISVAKLPSMPGLVIADVTFRENDFYSIREATQVTDPTVTDFVEIAPPTTVDLVFTIAGLSTSSIELLNLAAVTKRFFRKNPYLSLARDPSDLSKGSVRYEMDSFEDKETKYEITASKDNVKNFILIAVVHGFDIEGMSGLPLGGPAGVSEGAQNAGKTADVVTLQPSGLLDE